MLDYTPKEMAQRETLVINPAKICQPIGAILAYKGIHNCMPITHGSQGCSSYLRHGSKVISRSGRVCLYTRARSRRSEWSA